MLIKGTEGFLPFQNSTTRFTALSGGRCTGQEMVASLCQQVRTNTSTGKIQELHRQVSSGEYQISPREVAARILLLEEGE